MNKGIFRNYKKIFTAAQSFTKVAFLRYFGLALFLLISFETIAQVEVQGDEFVIDYSTPREFEVGGVTVSNIRYLDANALKTLFGIKPGDKIKIPGDELNKGIQNMWKQGILTDIKVYVKSLRGNLVFIDLYLTEKPRLSKFSFPGATKNEAEKLREKVGLVRGKVITPAILQTAEYQASQFYIDKGYFNVKVTAELKDDSLERNSQIILLRINKGKRVKIHEIIIDGNEVLSDNKIKGKLKETKEKSITHIFKVSKYIEENFEKDKAALIEKYQEMGYRDAEVVVDSVYRHDESTVTLYMKIYEGHQYYFRNLNFIGNTKHSSKELSSILGISKGEIYNKKKFDQSVFMNQSGRDISSLYLDDGYLFFNISPVEVRVENDSIDYEIRIQEGPQATVNKVSVSGNTKTNDRVIMREIRTQPGQLFSRNDVIRTQRELAQLGYFDPEKFDIKTMPNAADGTVDIEYVVEEKPSDQLELSGGYGAGQLVGTLGLSFTNFSMRNFLNGDAWRPLPTGDGQRLSLRAQSSGAQFQSYNISFTEPYLGGKKPNAFSVTVFHSVQNPGGRKKTDPLRQTLQVTGVSVGLGKRLSWPDDFFMLYHELSFQRYKLQNYQGQFLYEDGQSYSIALTETFSRNSVDQPIYPRRGSNFSLSMALTPPYSLFRKNRNTDYSTLPPEEKYKWIEYNKWKFNAEVFSKLAGNLVLHTRMQFGFLGYYNPAIGQSPFERFWLGGDGLSGFSLDGREIIALRGYDNNSLTPYVNGQYVGGCVYNKYTVELRYPVSLNPSATIYGLAYMEAGNDFLRFKDYSPFNIKRSAGAGVRIFLPMFGLLGLDWGYGFDNSETQYGIGGSHFHFMIGQQF